MSAALSTVTAASAAGEVRVCLIETGGHAAEPLRDAFVDVASDIDATARTILVGVRARRDLEAAVDLFVAAGCHLIVTASAERTRAILTLSAADGPMPQTRRAVQLVGRLGLDDAVVYVHRLDLNDDPELLELVRLEMRDLMTREGLPGDDVRFEQCTPECRGEAFLSGD